MSPFGKLLAQDPKQALYRICQRAMLRIPVLSEMRLAGDKVMGFLRVWHYLARAKVHGDYLEFGVLDGMSFELSLSAASKFFPRTGNGAPRFIAFDSFSGLPAPDGEKDSTVFHEGQYFAPRKAFERNIAKAAKGWRVDIVQGFYNETLSPKLREDLGLKQAAFINIDCDLYSSTMDALDFCTPLIKTGTAIFFDDWYLSEGDMSLGEAQACKEWLAKNPHISLIDFGDVAIMGKMFLANVDTSKAPKK
jgi:hypothetical protein